MCRYVKSRGSFAVVLSEALSRSWLLILVLIPITQLSDLSLSFSLSRKTSICATDLINEAVGGQYGLS